MNIWKHSVMQKVDVHKYAPKDNSSEHAKQMH